MLPPSFAYLHYGMFLSKKGLLRFCFFFFLLFDIFDKGKCYLLVFQRKGNDRPIDTVSYGKRNKRRAKPYIAVCRSIENVVLLYAVSVSVGVPCSDMS